ncbi:uncharacterized protein K460DRAFT_347564 [Cucurbitaria berberidis CBS 394.84]|uniref:ubiquitinyl hydrolase 1 n=1 Tax=Cucurbitaria berberidis CBS 394.84 TaxID=1168544 RepID=A0A9P4G8V1_9PLEO|nr:uncharacterized protein K460DRAFT_347564 [Cucurbitaria berberidis CBS 394.84]KAF1841017.1 hypothetical protein K460DRAFT_347564 [Cucurbitaria berberidis CBS 394.84]
MALAPTTYLYHHIVLPPKLPQENDHVNSHERHLFSVVIQVLKDLRDNVRNEHIEAVTSAIATIENLRDGRDHYGDVSEAQLLALLTKLTQGETTGAVPLEIKAQNAGILVSRCSDNLYFEFFELSPTNEAAMRSGRLTRTFPGHASRIPVTKMAELELQKTLASTIAKMTTQTAPGFQPQVRKNGEMLDEDRDTTHPGLVTDFLMNMIAAVGEATDVPGIIKNTREETLWSNCLQPWRRSPLWLLIRVSLQLLFARNDGNTRSSGKLYKAFMIFMLSQLLESAKNNWQQLGSEVLHIITVKLARRLRKFELLGQDECLQPHWATSIQSGITSAHNIIKTHWQGLVGDTQANIDTAAVRTLRPTADLDLPLPELDTFLSEVATRQRNISSSSFRPTSEYLDFPAAELPDSLAGPEADTYFRLAAFEKWVEKHLRTWILLHLNDVNTCGRLRRLIEHYYACANTAYAGIPIGLSLMYLTVTELWAACDVSACIIHPLLHEYDPEICLTEFQCLVLPLKSQMKRLHEVECYVKSRRDAAYKSQPSVYRNFGHASSFAVRFFEQSDDLQATLSHIEQDATEKRAQKCEELKTMKREYTTLMDHYNNSACETHEALTGSYHGFAETRHKSDCSRCACKSVAASLTIQIYEWPLSSVPSVAKATVFELKVPQAFSDWRDASRYFIMTVLRHRDKFATKPECSYTLDKHAGLFQMLSSRYRERQIVLLSSIKPHTVTHRRFQKAIPHLNDDDVCLKNALQYAYYDKSQDFINSAAPVCTEELPKQCMYQIPLRSNALKRFLYKPPSNPDGLPPNEVIASLSDCPAHLSIEEYKALGAMPLGSRIIYSNILAQLAIPTVDLTKVETLCFILQIVQQVGLPDKHIERQSHYVLTEASFGHAMLGQLEIALQRVAENWESWRALASYSLLARRLLSFSLCSEVLERSLDYLAELRRVFLRWAERLKQRAHSSADIKQRDELFSRAIEIALLCTSTYDVEEAHIEEILQQQPAISTFLRCSILVQDNHRSVRPEFPALYKTMFQSWRALMYRVLPKLRKRILLDNTELNEVVTANWAAFQPALASRWVSLNKPHEHWLHILSGTLPVHFNLLTAKLVVNGLPIARLPWQFIRHSMYFPLFQKSMLEVVPTDEHGMTFSAKTKYHGHKLYLGLKDEEMLVVAVGDNSRLDLLPSSLFQDRLPHAFVTNFIHWFDHTKGEVVFRSRATPWSCNPGDWNLKRDDSARTWRLVKGSSTLVDRASNSARVLSRMFRSLEDANHIHVVLDSISQTIDIQLPRLQLGFFVEHNDARIYSRQYRGMIVDDNQGIGTLVGLSSKLVLQKSGHERLVLIPVPHKPGSQSIRYAKDSDLHHVTVDINKDDVSGVYVYSLDKVLGRILDTGDIQSRLFLCYLSALTSHCVPDPFTGYTGTEAALTILQSAALLSFSTLTQTNIEFLGQIAALSPRRSFYPASEMVMQQIAWDPDLPSLSQHPSLSSFVHTIFEQAGKMQLFYPENNTCGLINKIQHRLFSSSHLDKRDAIRSSIFRVSGFGAEQYSTIHDVQYDARDRQQNSERGERAFLAATLIARDTAALHQLVPDLKDNLLQMHFGTALIRGIKSSFCPSNLRFDSKWLEDSSTHLTELWCSLHHGLANASGDCNKFDIMAWLATMAYATSADINAIQALSAFYRLQRVAEIEPPSAYEYDLDFGATCRLAEVHTEIQRFARPYRGSAEARLPRQALETDRQHTERTYALFQTRQNAAIANLSSALQLQWPVRNPSTPRSTEFNAYLRTSAAVSKVSVMFNDWYDNRCFLEYLQEISVAMARQEELAVLPSCYNLALVSEKRSLSDEDRHFSTRGIFAGIPPTISRNCKCYLYQSSPLSLIPPCEPELLIVEQSLSTRNLQMKNRLENFCHSLQAYAKSKCEKDYVNQLRTSCAALDEHISSDQTRSVLAAGTEDLLRRYLYDCEEYFDKINRALVQCIENSKSLSDQLGFCIQNSPRISPSFWLSQLHRDRFDSLSEPWKAIIIEYGLAITHLHRAQRLVALSDKPIDLAEELKHVRHSNWNGTDSSETLLLEAESGIMVRKEQEFIASHMRSPQNSNNIVLQLLMGGGKSTVVTPMVAAALTDKHKVIVAKPQSKQMLYMLISKLGGLLNRRIYHLPFSRALKITADDANMIQELYRECMVTRGVLLIQPEHILSFKLMGIEMLLSNQDEAARSMLSTQEFFDAMSRDIVDESDENYSVKFELVYTMGSQQSIDFAPERWLIIQEVLGLVPRFATQVKNSLPQAVDIQDNGDGKFPRIRLLRSDAADLLLDLLARHVVEWGISGLPSHSQPPNVQAAILRYITQADLKMEDVKAVEDSKFWTVATKSPLLLVRGLIAGGVLRFTLSKRWRVNFGLDPARTSLAVPYRAKDSPSPRSEFSHPDVMILLTLLSYYYGGLSDEALFDTMAHVSDSDQAAIHYDEFVTTASSSLPAAFRQLSGVSIRDRHQCTVAVFPALRYSKKAVDYYLSYLVFPKQLRQFPRKLSASGWDLGMMKTHPTTGFSGTNDTLHLLPLDVKHLDLPSQSHTNAQVVSYLLQDETLVEPLPPRTRGSDAQHLLTVIEKLDSDVRVILDCGATILEQNNEQVAEIWLKMRTHDIQAVVFFNDEEISVLDRTGRIESFQTSPFAKTLDVCLVYLDEAHTRGTDLKLPRDYRAAVTLGSQLTKDRLTQACMRMRKLGHGQAVTFIVPEEVSTKILERTGKPNAPIDVCDVLCWSITETWQDLKRSMPLWAVQGLRFESHRHLLRGANTTKDEAKGFLEDEAQDLETRYKPRTRDDDDHQLSRWDMSNNNIAQIASRCRDFEAMGFGSVSFSEEQERELAPEIEEERQIECSPPMSAEWHSVHRDLCRLVLFGELAVNSRAWRPAFKALHSTSAAKLFNLDGFPTFPSELLVTEEFMRTVKIPSDDCASFVSDSYQRPVQFILSVPSCLFKNIVRHFIIVSPVEANLLLPLIRESNKVTLHLFAPRSNSSFAPLDKLELYNVGHEFSPDWVSRSLTMQLNLFAGSLYLRSVAEYHELCDFLGLLRTTATDGQQVYADGFMDPPTGKWGLHKSPVPFLRALLMKIRHEGEGFEKKTHMGKILNGVRLEEGDFRAET